MEIQHYNSMYWKQEGEPDFPVGSPSPVKIGFSVDRRRQGVRNHLPADLPPDRDTGRSPPYRIHPAALRDSHGTSLYFSGGRSQRYVARTDTRLLPGGGAYGPPIPGAGAGDTGEVLVRSRKGLGLVFSPAREVI